MKVVVESPSPILVTFESLAVSEAFRFNEIIYLKVSETGCFNFLNEFVSHSYCGEMNPLTKVERMDAVLTVKPAKPFIEPVAKQFADTNDAGVIQLTLNEMAIARGNIDDAVAKVLERVGCTTTEAYDAVEHFRDFGDNVAFVETTQEERELCKTSRAMAIQAVRSRLGLGVFEAKELLERDCPLTAHELVTKSITLLAHATSLITD